VRPSNHIAFQTTSTGNVGIGTTIPATGRLEVAASAGILLYLANSGAGNTIQASGGALLTSGGVWTDASDSTRKTEIEEIPYGLREALELRPVVYRWKKNGQADIGFIAQEVQDIVPEVVHGEEGNMSMSYNHLAAVLAKAIQEQQEIIEDQRVQLKAHEAEDAAMRVRMDGLTQRLDQLVASMADSKTELHGSVAGLLENSTVTMAVE
jgi:hypothetical protein